MKKLILVAAAVPKAALAHPGDHAHAGVMHLLTEPDHLAMIGAVGALIIWTALKIRGRR